MTKFTILAVLAGIFMCIPPFFPGVLFFIFVIIYYIGSLNKESDVTEYKVEEEEITAPPKEYPKFTKELNNSKYINEQAKWK